MSLLRWKDEYLTQVEEIDTQHQRLIDLINGIYDLMRSGRGDEAIAEAMGEVVDFTRFHFSTEEKFMESTEYAGREGHVGEHERLLDQVVDLRRSVQDGRTVVSMNEMYFLKDWLLSHFQGPDRGLAHHLLTRALPLIEDAAI
jgi:hemerythrin-like metal-binding protein